MNILLISFYDDNFGDMLIRTCFRALLTVVLENLGIGTDDVVLSSMHIKDIDEQRVCSSDLIFFAGGAMFGVNNLRTLDHIEAVTAIADERDIPVVFSSLGLNHMEDTDENTARLNAVLRRPCVRAMSVRENAEVFAPFTTGCSYPVLPVCDPAVWTRYLYDEDIQAARRDKPDHPIVGINVVRGGLFTANGRNWNIEKEEDYLLSLSSVLEMSGIDYRFYTNGSFLDNNTMGHFARKLEHADDRFVYPDSTREVIRAIASFDAVVAIRMHSSIIAYSLGVPSLNLIWNDKIPPFYRNIGYPDRAIELSDSDRVPELVNRLLADTDYHPDSDYMMSLYRFLFDTLCAILCQSGEIYPFEQVCDRMRALSPPDSEDVTDYRTKLQRGKYCYLTLFNISQNRKYEIKELRRQLRRSEIRLQKLNTRLSFTQDKLDSTKQSLKKKSAEAARYKQQLDRIYHLFPVRVYRWLRQRLHRRAT